MKEENKYEINTGEIFSILYIRHCNNIEPLDNAGRYKYILEQIEYLLRKYKIITFTWERLSAQDKIYYINDIKNSMPKAVSLSTQDFLKEMQYSFFGCKTDRYFVLGRSDLKKDDSLQINPFDIVQYNTLFTLPYKDNEGEYRLFLALKVSFTDVSEIYDLLNYHFKKHFNGNEEKYMSFLNDMLLGESKLIDAGYAEKVRQYMSKYVSNKASSPEVRETLPENPSLPTFQHVKEIVSVFKNYFDSTQHEVLESLLKEGIGNEILLFNGEANQLADLFKRLFMANLITGYDKKHLIKWIFTYFQYKNKNGINSSFNEKYLHDIISTDQKECKNPIIGITKDEKGNVNIFSPNRKGRTKG